ncbi:CBS domain-containing protein [Magnetovibrio sp. PR-2]|uniref:CBS domain-containing protein n=1 Tax=Magnetovibrio sp. PR-2 TaxID=3120356 RepID=UPI002FCE49CD
MSEQSYVKVEDIMSTNIETIDAMATVHDAVTKMRDAGVSSLVADRRDQTDEYGLVVVSDIAKQVVSKNRAPERVNVYEIMSKPVLTVPKDMNIRYAVRLLTQFGLSRGIVVDEHRAPVGIVTLRDLVLRHID